MAVPLWWHQYQNGVYHLELWMMKVFILRDGA